MTIAREMLTHVARFWLAGLDGRLRRAPVAICRADRAMHGDRNPARRRVSPGRRPLRCPVSTRILGSNR
jgi:hypothetical protein